MRTDCADCNGNGFVAIDDTAVGSRLRVRPCVKCNFPAYERWMNSHYEVDHWCMDCENVRRGRRVT